MKYNNDNNNNVNNKIHVLKKWNTKNMYLQVIVWDHTCEQGVHSEIWWETFNINLHTVG